MTDHERNLEIAHALIDTQHPADHPEWTVPLARDLIAQSALVDELRAENTNLLRAAIDNVAVCKDYFTEIKQLRERVRVLEAALKNVRDVEKIHDTLADKFNEQSILHKNAEGRVRVLEAALDKLASTALAGVFFKTDSEVHAAFDLPDDAIAFFDALHDAINARALASKEG